MTFLLKDPAAVLDYSIDWGAEYLGDDLISTSEWSVSPAESGGVTIENLGPVWESRSRWSR